jgi:hypothetical protein
MSTNNNGLEDEIAYLGLEAPCIKATEPWPLAINRIRANSK